MADGSGCRWRDGSSMRHKLELQWSYYRIGRELSGSLARVNRADVPQSKGMVESRRIQVERRFGCRRSPGAAGDCPGDNPTKIATTIATSRKSFFETEGSGSPRYRPGWSSPTCHLPLKAPARTASHAVLTVLHCRCHVAFVSDLIRAHLRQLGSVRRNTTCWRFVNETVELLASPAL